MEGVADRADHVLGMLANWYLVSLRSHVGDFSALNKVSHFLSARRQNSYSPPERFVIQADELFILFPMGFLGSWRRWVNLSNLIGQFRKAYHVHAQLSDNDQVGAAAVKTADSIIAMNN